MTEDKFDEIKDYEEHTDALTGKQLATLRLTDAYLMATPVDDDLRAQAFEHFTAGQLVGLTLKMANYTSQKMLVALGADLEYDGREKTEDGFNKIEHENYIQALAGDTVNLPSVKRADR